MSVLVNGASGTGKEHVAQLIHRQSKRAGKLFVAVDCGAIPQRPGCFGVFRPCQGVVHGAVGDKTGAFEAASGGTLFLDEVGNLTYETQDALLRALRSAVFVPWAATAKSLSTSDWSQRPTKTSKRRSRAGRSVPTSTTVSTNLRSVCLK